MPCLLMASDVNREANGEHVTVRKTGTFERETA